LAAVVVAYVVFNDELEKIKKLTIQNQTKELQETEANYSKEGDASRDRRFKSIEEEIKLDVPKEKIARKAGSRSTRSFTVSALSLFRYHSCSAYPATPLGYLTHSRLSMLTHP
jgi:hypothetical protein